MLAKKKNMDLKFADIVLVSLCLLGLSHFHSSVRASFALHVGNI